MDQYETTMNTLMIGMNTTKVLECSEGLHERTKADGWWPLCEVLNIKDTRDGNIILTKFSSLAAPEIVMLTTFKTARDENLVKMTFLFRCRIDSIFLTASEVVRTSGATTSGATSDEDFVDVTTFSFQSYNTSKMWHIMFTLYFIWIPQNESRL